jgi:hypothetical protein
MFELPGWLIPLLIPVLALAFRLLRRPLPWVSEAARALRDLITLRMVLRDTEPAERAELLDAHNDWRSTTPVPRSGKDRRSGAVKAAAVRQARPKRRR